MGYKVHIGVDQGSGLVRTAAFTTAKVYESEVADDLVSGDEEAVYGDKAYESKRRRLWLRSLGIKDRAMHRSHKVQRGLPHWPAAPQRVDIAGAVGSGKGVRDAETQL